MSETHSYKFDCRKSFPESAFYGRRGQFGTLAARGLQPYTMMPMMRSSLFRLSLVVAAFGLVLASLTAVAQQKPPNRGRKYKAPPPTARIEVTVVRDVNDRPIENAAVIFHLIGGEKGNMELKTNEDGKAIIDVLNIGYTVRMQIIAKGFQTFGDDYKIDKANMAIEIRMRRPGEQYSIYKHHPDTIQGGKSPDEAKPPAQPEAQPGSSPPKPN